MTFSTQQVQIAELRAMEAEIMVNHSWAGCRWSRETLVLSFSWNNDFISCQEAIWQVPSCGFPQKKCWLEGDPSHGKCLKLSLLEGWEIAMFTQVDQVPRINLFHPMLHSRNTRSGSDLAIDCAGGVLHCGEVSHN